jgi:dolichol-phosphate mannosyltransferase
MPRIDVSPAGQSMNSAVESAQSIVASAQNRAGGATEKRKLISVIIPVFNEENNIDRAYQEVCRIFDAMARYDLEIIFTDNHSIDRTPAVLEALANKDARVKVIRFARNFGFQKSVLTGYRMAAGDAAFQLDCDLQDPPALFPSFLALWEQGHDVIVGVRRSRKESKIIENSRKLFYRLMIRFSDDNLIPDAGDFRLVDRSILNQLRTIHEAHPYTRGLISSLAARQTGIPYDRARREFDNSKFPVRRLFGLAMDGILAHSLLPLRLATYFGFVMSAVLFLLSVFYIVARLIGGSEWPSGFATVAALVAMGISLNAIFLGIMGEYIGRIYNQIRQRPITVIEATFNLAPGSALRPRPAGQPEESGVGYAPPVSELVQESRSGGGEAGTTAFSSVLKPE